MENPNLQTIAENLKKVDKQITALLEDQRKLRSMFCGMRHFTPVPPNGISPVFILPGEMEPWERVEYENSALRFVSDTQRRIWRTDMETIRLQDMRTKYEPTPEQLEHLFGPLKGD